ncbi:MAG: hypothetical protein ACP5DZ_01080 [Bacteroidales bacterium]
MTAIYDHGELSNLSVYLYDDPGDRIWKFTPLNNSEAVSRRLFNGVNRK